MDKHIVLSIDLIVAFLVVLFMRAISPNENPSPYSPFLSSFSKKKLNLFFIKLVLPSIILKSTLSKLKLIFFDLSRSYLSLSIRFVFSRICINSYWDISFSKYSGRYTSTWPSRTI